MKDKNKIYFYIAIFLLSILFYFNFNFSTFKEGFTAAENVALSSVTVTGQARPLSISANGLQIYIPSTAWQTYQNLPSDFVGLVTTTSINNGPITFKVSTPGKAYLMRSPGWSSVPLDGWTLLNSGPYITASGTINVYSRQLAVGTYTLSDSSAMYMFKPDVGSGSGSDSSCSALIADTLKYEKESLDAKSQAMAVEEDYIYNQARILSAPSISQLNVGTGIINELTQETDGLKKQITDERDAANNAEILQLRIDASNNDATNATTKAILEQTISELQTSINTNTSQLEQHDRDAKIREAVERTEKDWNAKYTSLNDGINTQISQKIGGYTPQYTLQQTMRDICDNVISSIGDTTKVLTDKMGNFVGPDGLLSKFNGFTNDNTLYSSIDKIDTNVTEQDIILKNILNTLKYYTENKNNVDDSGNVIKPIPYEADSLIHIDTNHFCFSDYDDKLGAPLCCGQTGVLDDKTLNDQCGPYAKYCVKAKNKMHGFCSSNKPTIT